MFYIFMKLVNRGILITIPTVLLCFLDYIILDLTKIIQRTFPIYSSHTVFSEVKQAFCFIGLRVFDVFFFFLFFILTFILE